MADVRPLPAVRYASARAGDIGRLLAPPYDVIPEEDLAGYRARSPYNVVRLIRPGADYASAARLVGEWLEAGVLVEDEPSMYVHEVSFDGRRRRDLLAALRLQPYEDRVVLPHERTHRGPKEDRLALFRATGMSFEPLWFLYEGRATDLPRLLEDVCAEPAEVEFTWAEKERHRLWAIRDRGRQEAARSALAPLPVLIADGHHRYETSLAYAEEVGGAPDAASRFAIGLLTDLDDPGLEVLPTHRLLKAGVAVSGGEPAGSLAEVLGALPGRVAAGTYREGRYQVLPLEGELAVVELHGQVIDNLLGRRSLEESVAYTRDAEEAVRWVDEGKGVAAFFLDAPHLRTVLNLAREGITLPQKSTYFHPKPPSGLLFHRLDPSRVL